MLPLPTAQEGEVIEIKKITGNDATRLHLAEMGFTVGSKITVVTRLGGWKYDPAGTRFPRSVGRIHGTAHHVLSSYSSRSVQSDQYIISTVYYSSALASYQAL